MQENKNETAPEVPVQEQSINKRLSPIIENIARHEIKKKLRNINILYIALTLLSISVSIQSINAINRYNQFIKEENIILKQAINVNSKLEDLFKQIQIKYQN